MGHDPFKSERPTDMLYNHQKTDIYIINLYKLVAKISYKLTRNIILWLCCKGSQHWEGWEPLLFRIYSLDSILTGLPLWQSYYLIIRNEQRANSAPASFQSASKPVNKDYEQIFFFFPYPFSLQRIVVSNHKPILFARLKDSFCSWATHLFNWKYVQDPCGGVLFQYNQ